MTWRAFDCNKKCEARFASAHAASRAAVSRGVHAMSNGESLVGPAELHFGDSVMYLSDEWPGGGVLSPLTIGGTANSFVLDVTDADGVFDRAVGMGAVSMRAVSDQFYGARAGQLRDPFGYSWSISTPAASASSEGDRAAVLAEVPKLNASRDAGYADRSSGEVGGGDSRGAGPAHPPFRAEDLWNEVGYYTIGVADPESARTFFNGLFGWELPDPELSEADYFGMHNPSTHIPMGFVRGEGSLLGPRLYFRVRDLGEMCERVVSLGGVIVSRDGYESGGNAVCRDDQGFEFDLWQPAPGY